jgi:putative oxidoreductase
MLTKLNNEELAKLILRLGVGGMMLFHGVAKMMHAGSVDFIMLRLAEAGLPGFIAYGVYVGEVIAPLMIILGLFSRHAAVLIVINMLFAILLVHTGDILALTKHGGWRLELQGFYLLCSVSIILLGSGRYAFKPD